MYEEDLPLTAAALAVGGGTVFDTWWIAVVGVTLVVTGTALIRLTRRVRRPSGR